MNVLLYMNYGKDRRYHLELTYSVLSAWEFLKSDPADTRIVLISDEHNQRPDLPVEHVLMDQETIHEWQMNGTYNHAMQAYALHHVLALYGAPTVLIDSDTYFKRHPKELFARVGPGRSLMNRREGRLYELNEWTAFERCFERLEGRIDGMEATRDIVMYNAGIIGVHPSDIDLMTGVKAVMFAVRAQSDVFTAVQLAASMVLERKTQLSTCEDVVEHYWGGPRHYYQYQIKKMFPQIMQVKPIAMPSGPLPPLQEIPSGPFFQQLVARLKLLGRKVPPAYRFALVASFTAHSLRTKNPELANVWAVTAANILIWGLQSRPEGWAKDFHLFAPERVADQAWLEEDVRKKWLNYWSGSLGPN